MRSQLNLTAAAMAVFVTAWLAYNRDVTETSTFGVFDVWQYEMVPIENGAVGPESFAFDP
ncbi:adipocyte plasma membrane-associated protein, partial [Trifolium medium]|nr:adipocyte plasma membrane-associated protein [Trifolium medium]